MGKEKTSVYLKKRNWEIENLKLTIIVNASIKLKGIELLLVDYHNFMQKWVFQTVKIKLRNTEEQVFMSYLRNYVVPIEQMWNSLLEDLRRLAQLAA